MTLWKFEVTGDVVSYGTKNRRKVTDRGCNEPFKDRYWCPKKQWFSRESCPFVNRHECENFEMMCSSRCG